MRDFGYLTVGKVLAAIHKLGLKTTRATYYKKEIEWDLPHPRKQAGSLRWRVYTREDLEKIVQIFKENYSL